MNEHAFTLIELIVTIAIAAILLTIAVPGFQNMVIENRIATQTNELVSDLALARSEAIKRGQRISICAAADSTTCLSAGTTWTTGRIVYVGGAPSGAVPTANILRYTEPQKGVISLTDTSSTGASYYVSYLPSGGIDRAATLTLCNTGYIGRNITVNTTGRTATSKTAAVCT